MKNGRLIMLTWNISLTCDGLKRGQKGEVQTDIEKFDTKQGFWASKAFAFILLAQCSQCSTPLISRRAKMHMHGSQMQHIIYFVQTICANKHYLDLLAHLRTNMPLLPQSGSSHSAQGDSQTSPRRDDDIYSEINDRIFLQICNGRI